MTKKRLVYAFLPMLAMGFMVGSVANAAPQNGMENNSFFTSIVATIAKKFNIPEADLQAAVKEAMTARHTEMQKNRPERVDPLAQAVKDGKITQAQADLIKAKREALRAEMEKIKDGTQTEKEALQTAHKQTLKQWATDNKIPEQYVMSSGLGFGRGNGEGKGMGRGMGGGRMHNKTTQATNK